MHQRLQDRTKLKSEKHTKNERTFKIRCPLYRRKSEPQSFNHLQGNDVYTSGTEQAMEPKYCILF